MICTCGKEVEFFIKGTCKKCYDRKRSIKRWINIKNNPELHEKVKLAIKLHSKKRRRESIEIVIRGREGCRNWYLKNKEYRKKYYREYYLRRREYHLYRGKMRKLGLEPYKIDFIHKKYENKCFKCHKSDCKLDIHHIDGNGLNKLHKNNSINNLVLLCVSCHMKIHKNITK